MDNNQGGLPASELSRILTMVREAIKPYKPHTPEEKEELVRKPVAIWTQDTRAALKRAYKEVTTDLKVGHILQAHRTITLAVANELMAHLSDRAKSEDVSMMQWMQAWNVHELYDTMKVTLRNKTIGQGEDKKPLLESKLANMKSLADMKIGWSDEILESMLDQWVTNYAAAEWSAVDFRAKHVWPKLAQRALPHSLHIPLLAENSLLWPLFPLHAYLHQLPMFTCTCFTSTQP